MIRWHVVSAVFGRNVKQYFSGPLGYLFIVVFVSVCAVMAFSPQFFADNLTSLDQLSRWLPMLLLFFIPAITMTVWADEKRQGTDSILFTLPASDLDILLGKYFSVAAVYSVALLFSTTQLIVLMVIGNPDWGVIFATYVGYWLAGLALLAIGMFASSLTRSATVAFVLGTLFCSIPVLMGQYFHGTVGLERFGFDWNLREFTIGLIPLANVVYFLALTLFMLYLNLVVISRRHWYRGQRLSLGGQYLLRLISFAVILVSIGYLCSTAISSRWARTDLTAEKLYTLDQATVEVLNKIKQDERAVTIQAFISSEVPRKYVDTRKQFIGLLRQFSEYGGGNVTVRYVDVSPDSQAALDADQLGIEPQEDRSEIDGRMIEQEVYLGAHISTSLGDVTIPLIDSDSSIEYELTRSIATTVDKKQQITLGILDTDAHFGGPEIDGRRLEWSYSKTLTELKKQFKIKHIAQDDLAKYVESEESDVSDSAKKERSVKTAPDVLLVADPSSLSDDSIEALVSYVEAGNPVLVLADPLPFYWAFQNPINLGVLNAPRQARVSARSPYSRILSSSPLPKSNNGSASKLFRALGIEWDHGAAAWTLDNPHPNFNGNWSDYLGTSWPENYGTYEKAFVFARDHNDVTVFDQTSILSQGLKELLMFYPGSIRQSESSLENSKLHFQPLVRLGSDSGLTPWEELTHTPEQTVRMIDPRTGQMRTDTQKARSEITQNDLIVLASQPGTKCDEDDHILAARITGSEGSALDVVVIADLDFVSDLFYQQQEALGQKLDNLSFLQNSIEVLAGNESFVALRNRRVTPRTLEKLEAVFDDYRLERTNQQEAAESEVRDELSVEQKKLDVATQEIQENQSLTFFQKLQRTSQEASDAQRRFDLRKKKLDRQLKQTIGTLETEERKRILNVENWTRFTSIFTAPLPALILGAIVLCWRYREEQKNITPERRV